MAFGGPWLHQRWPRLGVALWLRRPANPRAPSHSTNGKAWPTEREAAAAEATFRASPQFAKLVEDRILLKEGTSPTNDQIIAATMGWEAVWAAINRTLASIDRASFMREVDATLAAKPRRRHRRRDVKLGPAEIAYADTLLILRRGILRGNVKLDLLEALREAADAAGAAPALADAEREEAQEAEAKRAEAARESTIARARGPSPRAPRAAPTTSRPVAAVSARSRR